MAANTTHDGARAEVLAIVAAHNEADRIAATLSALARSFPGSAVWVADDGSRDETAALARAAGARVVGRERPIGKGGSITIAARAALESLSGADETVVLLCDGDLGESAAKLRPLLDALASGDADLAVAAFARRVGGGFGVARGFARRAIARRCGLQTEAPISGQRAMRASTLRALLPFADGFGMETGMTIDAVRAGFRVVEVEVDLRHRATGRTVGGFAHRGRQFLDIARAEWVRR
jgi:glycosyltransferase involved in cell wall biosynthesis